MGIKVALEYGEAPLGILISESGKMVKQTGMGFILGLTVIDMKGSSRTV